MLQLIQLRLAFGDLPLLDGASLALSRNECVGLVGRNGSGKSSLLKIVAGFLASDDGLVQREEGLRIVLVEQEPALPEADTLVASLLQRAGWSTEPDDPQGWQQHARLHAWIDRFGLRSDRAFGSIASLSGGEAKRAALALAFALEPDLLLLDEPTNHLDMAGIRCLEEAMDQVSSSVVISHDRFFLDRVVSRIVELDRGQLRSYPGRYSDYLGLRADQWAAEEKSQRQFERFWADEEVWIRQGVQARRTRNQGRVRRLEELRREREARRDRLASVKLRLDAGERSGKLVLECKALSYTNPAGRVLVKDFDWVLTRGDRVAVIGPNGIGKSTLLRLALGALKPGSGRVRQGTQWQLAYFDQMREQLDENATVAQSISPGSEWVEAGGKRLHVMAYLADFLFSPRRASAPVRTLSGGERNRLLLARLFSRPANLLVLDEPTNDLDLETLELLESTLQQYTGTVLLVSHDRAFIDAVATQTLVAMGGGQWREYPGGYSDWIAQGGQWPEAEGEPGKCPGDRSTVKADSRGSALKSETLETKARGESGERRKLSFKEQRELEQMPVRVAALEREQEHLQQRMLEPDYFRKAAEGLREDRARIDSIESELLACLERWEVLETIAESREKP